MKVDIELGCALCSEAVVQRRGEEQGDHTGGLLHGILHHLMMVPDLCAAFL